MHALPAPARQCCPCKHPSPQLGPPRRLVRACPEPEQSVPSAACPSAAPGLKLLPCLSRPPPRLTTQPAACPAAACLRPAPASRLPPQQARLPPPAHLTTQVVCPPQLPHLEPRAFQPRAPSQLLSAHRRPPSPALESSRPRPDHLRFITHAQARTSPRSAPSLKRTRPPVPSSVSPAPSPPLPSAPIRPWLARWLGVVVGCGWACMQPCSADPPVPPAAVAAPECSSSRARPVVQHPVRQ